MPRRSCRNLYFSHLEYLPRLPFRSLRPAPAPRIAPLTPPLSVPTAAPALAPLPAWRQDPESTAPYRHAEELVVFTAWRSQVALDLLLTGVLPTKIGIRYLAISRSAVQKTKRSLEGDTRPNGSTRNQSLEYCSSSVSYHFSLSPYKTMTTARRQIASYKKKNSAKDIGLCLVT